MRDVLLGVLSILVGAAFCFRGFIVMRLLLSLWGAFVGFFLGGGVVAGLTGDGFFGDVLPWVVGAIAAVVFAVLAYAYYAFSVFLAMASIGFLLGASLMVGLGIEWTWVVVLVGVIVGALLAGMAIVGRLPMLLLILLSAMAGASAIVGGVMLLVGEMSSIDLGQRAVDRIDASPWWWLVYLALSVTGVVVQFRFIASPWSDVRSEWRHGERTVAT